MHNRDVSFWGGMNFVVWTTLGNRRENVRWFVDPRMKEGERGNDLMHSPAIHWNGYDFSDPFRAQFKMAGNWWRTSPSLFSFQLLGRRCGTAPSNLNLLRAGQGIIFLFFSLITEKKRKRNASRRSRRSVSTDFEKSRLSRTPPFLLISLCSSPTSSLSTFFFSLSLSFLLKEYRLVYDCDSIIFFVTRYERKSPIKDVNEMIFKWFKIDVFLPQFGLFFLVWTTKKRNSNEGFRSITFLLKIKDVVRVVLKKSDNGTTERSVTEGKKSNSFRSNSVLSGEQQKMDNNKEENATAVHSIRNRN